jgi:serine/threonine protein kinase
VTTVATGQDADVSFPEQLGRLRRIRQIGAGGFATVWLYRDDELSSDVAVKVLASNWAQDPAIRERFLAESRLLRRAESDHLVEVHDLGVTEAGIPWFVMTYADQGSVAELLRRGRPEPGVVADVVRQAARGLAALHAHDVVHRDVKPENLLLVSRPDGSRRVVVADLGVAKLLAAGSEATQHVGTRAYAAPEQADPTVELDARADVHGLGAVAYELITGRAPRAGLAHGEAPPTVRSLVPDVPETVDAIVMRALEPDRSHRWSDVTSFARALEAAVLGRPVPVPIPPAPRPARGRRTPWVLAVAAAAVLAVVAVTATLTLGGDDRFDASGQFETAAVEYVEALQSPDCSSELGHVPFDDLGKGLDWLCSEENADFVAAQCLDASASTTVTSLGDDRARVDFGDDGWVEVERGEDTQFDAVDLEGCR